jgi:hypothetical protein
LPGSLFNLVRLGQTCLDLFRLGYTCLEFVI